MKNSHCWLLLSLLAAASVCAPAFAATVSGNVQVSAQINKLCMISSVGNMSFGAYDTVASANQKDAMSSISVRCIAKSTNVNLSFSEGNNAAATSSCSAPERRMRVNGTAQYLTYNIYSNAARTSVFGCASGVNDHTYPSSVFTDVLVPVTLSVYGRLDGGQDVRIGNYIDSININLTF